MNIELETLQKELSACKHCEPELPLGAKPIFNFSATSKIAIIGQAPGAITHRNGLPWDDPSGIRLRNWLGVDQETFYDSKHFAIVPMGFCYPGKGKGGDLPPRKECAPLWHQRIWDTLQAVELYILIGQYAQKAYLGKSRKKNLTQTVQHFEEYLPQYFPLVHPSPRNQIWLRRNEWFEAEVIPVLQSMIQKMINN